MRPSQTSSRWLALPALLAALALSGCAAGEEPSGGSPSHIAQAREYVDQVRSEQGDGFVKEHFEEHQQEIEEGQNELEEDPNPQVAQEAQAEGAEARETIENEEAEDEAEEEGPEAVEHEPGEGRFVREG